ncbi:MAG: hypothetical protein ACK4M7_08680, partial [Burkholderiales bacterium]
MLIKLKSLFLSFINQCRKAMINLSVRQRNKHEQNAPSRLDELNQPMVTPSTDTHTTSTSNDHKLEYAAKLEAAVSNKNFNIVEKLLSQKPLRNSLNLALLNQLLIRAQLNNDINIMSALLSVLTTTPSIDAAKGKAVIKQQEAALQKLIKKNHHFVKEVKAQKNYSTLTYLIEKRFLSPSHLDNNLFNWALENNQERIIAYGLRVRKFKQFFANFYPSIAPFIQGNSSLDFMDGNALFLEAAKHGRTGAMMRIVNAFKLVK